MAPKFALRAAIEGPERLARMRENALRAIHRLRPMPKRPGRVAVCGYGPSLATTWKDIGRGQSICTVSGAHDFLIERGAIPTWHVEYDPRPHKCEFLKNARDDVTYCLASTCNAQMFEMLEGKQVLLWHAGANVAQDAQMINEVEEDGIILYGGSNAGLRAIMVAHVLGFREFDLHGFDCSYLPDTCWAGPHSGHPHQAFQVECNGKRFLTSAAMINSAEELFRTIFGDLAGCKFHLHGGGLAAERIRLMAVDRARAVGQWWTPVGVQFEKVVVDPAEQIDATITEEYREQNRLLHQQRPDYGAYGHRHAALVAKLCEDLGTRDVLDYGCGKRMLETALGFQIKNYDPAIPSCASRPEPADVVVCADVLEHIEPQCINAVLLDLARVTRKKLIAEIATRPAEKTLPDGRNAHLLIRSPDWWSDKVAQFFDVADRRDAPGSVTLTCEPKTRSA